VVFEEKQGRIYLELQHFGSIPAGVAALSLRRDPSKKPLIAPYI